MGTGLPPKWPYPGTTFLGSAGRNALTGSAASDLFPSNPLPVAPPTGDALAALAGTTFLGSAGRNALTSAASDLFPPYPPPPYPYASPLKRDDFRLVHSLSW